MEHNKSHLKILIYAGTLFLVVLSILAIATTIFVSKGSEQYKENTISVSGESEINAVPNIANFSFTIKETSKTNKEAQDIISEKITTILDGLEELGVQEKDIKTQSYLISPKYEFVQVERQRDISLDGTVYFPNNNQQRVQTGFDVSQNVSLVLRDFDKTGEVLELLAETGVDNLNGQNFEIDNPEALKEEVRTAAIKNAQEKAKRLADDLDVRLGKVVSFNENGGYYQPPRFDRGLESASFDSAKVSSVPALPVGENTISSSVTITYKIK
jgi:hypothetical protein